MRTLVSCLLIVVVAVALLMLVGCPSSKDATVTEGGPPGTGAGAPAETVGAEPGTQPAAATLTKEMVKNFMVSMEDDKIEDIMDGIAVEMGAEDEPDPETMRKVFDAAGGNAGLDAAVKAHGFSSAEEWVETAKKVLPGLTYAMAVAMAEMLGVEEGSEEFNDMMEDSEFREVEEVFGKPTDQEQQIITEAVKQAMEEEDAG